MKDYLIQVVIFVHNVDNIRTCSYKVSDIKDRPFIGFDFDDTLVKLRTNEPLPNVKDKLEELYRDFNIVIFSNQNGVQRENVS